MSAREIIAQWILRYADREARAVNILADLSAAGYRILAPGEVDAIRDQALAEIDRHIDAAKRMANDPYYKGSFPASIVIQDLQELRDAVAAAPAAPTAGGGGTVCEQKL